jgi:(1->4)-alpha-D-glucan 1-alpha-D-glucosylmutase
MVNSLAQLVLKITSLGVPDFYQGTELWDLSLVDPDNRRPVDYAHRDAMLAALEPWLDDAASSPRPAEECAAFIADLLEHWPDGRIKMFLTACGLRLRREAPDLFLEGDYIPIQAEGDRADHVVAFARRLGDRWVIAVVPRLAMLLTGPRPALPIGPAVWRNTFLRVPAELAAATLRDAFTGAAITPASTPEGTAAHVGDILAACPVALLTVGL